MQDSLTKLLDPQAIHAEIARRALCLQRNKLSSIFPEDGPLSRHNYPRHVEYFAAGGPHTEHCCPDCAKHGHRERMFCAGNRVGKTLAGAYETSLHLTGRYPDWWPGRRFKGPIDAWVSGQKSDTTRDVVQKELFGKWGNFGTGMIPHDALIDWTLKSRPTHSVDTFRVRHISGGISTAGFKAYSEGAGAFQGTAKHLIWFDEECGMDVYTEALLRTAIVDGEPDGGIVLVTFTPLLGWTAVVDSYLGSAEGIV